MDEFYIEKITEEVFEKARNRSASHKKYALAKEVEAATDLSYRTVERAYDKYIRRRAKGNMPTANTVEEFCKYLDYKDYAEFVEKNKAKERVNDPPDISQKDENEDSSVGTATVTNQKNWRSISIFGTFALTLIIAFYFIAENKASEPGAPVKCMTWNGTVYEEISCSAGSYSEYGTAIEPYDQKRFENFRRIDVDITTSFFSEQNQKPLVWYYKNENGEIEYYTAPGVHPVNGKTLKAVTEYIIEKYVPIHQNKSSSFIRD
ncbi:hypothetical protein DSM03_1011051 [Leeuwenhoekiella aestuarii]|uniref:Uncharacterized protein n=1 Tax=Leeuwenhoekiella aestuarii TaxID=2249426 RepID=A0A4Q0P2D7_9FLAO|nr:hypothetical protein [Leeuwenhoekiella aestuarii]RXG18369.1 hypothetical protein DSM04_101562 [Leeuwenhoekiella aestuarii]RXG19674.1 hypothetical protein DSM03_1011051 [Leeuwenhoekiella aestuarii]